MTHVFGNGDSVFEREAGSNGRVPGTAVGTEVIAFGSRMPLRDVRVLPR